MVKSKQTILIVDDEQPTVDSLELLLGETFNLVVVRSGEEALECIKSKTIDLVFLDITLLGMDGLETLKRIKQFDENIEVVMLTADEKAKTAMRAIELGAFHYITKPYDRDDILLVTRRVFEKKMMAAAIVSLRDDVQEMSYLHNIIGQSESMLKVYKLIEKVAQTDSSVLITGESGTGKELVAKAIHYQSSRRDNPFKAINCGSIPENLLESELFGYEKGAFTGAVNRKIGKFEMANGGTLFLDEISSMKEFLQIKLLRVLQEREIERVGGTQTIPVDVRIVAATNAHLRQLIENGQFREDLYYRINVIHIHLPLLREREGDIELLAENFLQFFSSKFKKPIQGLTEEALECLKKYPWPGNVRELRNVIERAVVLTDSDRIGKASLPLELSFAVPVDAFSSGEQVCPLDQVMDSYERKVLLNVLEHASWNQTKAAEMLGIHRNTLLVKMSNLGIDAKKNKKGDSEKALV